MARKRPPTEWEMELGKRLQRLREERGLTQTELAQRAGVPLRTYQNWEYGRRTPLADALVRLADALAITTDELLGRTPPGGSGKPGKKGNP